MGRNIGDTTWLEACFAIPKITAVPLMPRTQIALRRWSYQVRRYVLQEGAARYCVQVWYYPPMRSCAEVRFKADYNGAFNREDAMRFWSRAAAFTPSPRITLRDVRPYKIVHGMYMLRAASEALIALKGLPEERFPYDLSYLLHVIAENCFLTYEQEAMLYFNLRTQITRSARRSRTRRVED